MKMKAGMWFKDDFGTVRVLMSSTPDDEGDLFHMELGDHCWGYEHLSTIENTWTPMAREPWFSMPPVRHRTRTGWADHTIRAVYSPDGRRAMIICGCKAWPSLAAARYHYQNRLRPHLTYEQDQSFNAWALRYLDRLEAKMRERRAVKKLRKMTRRAA